MPTPEPNTWPDRPVGGVIENPVSGERIVIRETAAQTGGSVLVWELFLAPGGRVPSSHAHPEQEEHFAVIDGELRFRIGGRARTVRAGETVTVPPGAVHHFANAGPRPVHVLVESRPALDMEDLLKTAAALAQEPHVLFPTVPRPVDLALFMREFEREVRAPYLPVTLVRAVTRLLSWLAGRSGLDARYRRLRVTTTYDPSRAAAR